MRISFCSFDYPGSLGGPNSWLCRTLPMFEAVGIHCEVIFLALQPNECSNIKTASAVGLKTFVIDQGRYSTTEQLIREIMTEVKRFRPDVFVANMMVPALFAGRWIKQAGISTIGVLRSDDDFYCAMMDEFVFGREEFRLSGLICVSEMLEQEVLRRHPAGTLVTRIPSGTPVPDKVAKAPGSDFRLIYLGRLAEEQKRISEITRALCRASREIPNVTADIFGEGPDKSSVIKILMTEGAGLPVRLRGRIEPEQVLNELLARHALVLMSDYEGTPVAVMEAMAAGVVPICLWTRSGIPELVEDGVTGLIVRDRGDDFVRAVRQLRNDPMLWQRLSQAARARIKRYYSQETVANRWIEFLQKLHAMPSNRSDIKAPKKLRLPPVNSSMAPWDHREPTLAKRVFRLGKRLAKRGLRPLGQSPALKNGYWSARKALGFPVRHNAEILYWLRRQPELPNGSKTGSFRFPWGNFEYVSAGQLRAQFEEIFVDRQYKFSTDTSSPVIIDCGGNVGLSAIWFKLHYPQCQLTVYEADPDLAEILQTNLKRAGFEDALVRREAVWIANETVAFSKTGNDSGRIVSESSISYPAVDLSEHLPGCVDLLKMDIKGAEYQVLNRLCETKAIQRVQKLICEFHVWRDKTDDLLATLARIRESGMQFSMNAAAVPWIGLANDEAPFERIQRNHVLMEVFAWR